MPQRNSRNVWYAAIFMTLSIICTTAAANTGVFNLITELTSITETSISDAKIEVKTTATHNSISKKALTNSNVVENLMFATIIQNADEEVECLVDGITLAKFFLCGTNDDRTVTVSGGGALEWQQRLSTCAVTGSTVCPVNDGSCWPSSSTTTNTYSLDASDPNVATEYRVRSNGGSWYYFRVSQSTITQTSVVTPFVCGVNGRIQITGLSSAYEYSIDGGFLWQGPIFDDLAPGTYNILARQQGVLGACEYPYEAIEIVQQDIAFDVTFVDAQCSGDTGSVSVNVNNSVPGPYKYTLLDSSGVPQEFTAFLATDNYTFSTVGFGTYMVQVETPQCTGDPANSIDPPRENQDINGNPIVIGGGLSALDASTEVNNSFGCSTIASVDIILNATGGSAPYTYSVNGLAVAGSFTGSTTYTVTAAAGAGSYDFIVTDSNGCTIDASSSIEDLAPPTVTATGVDGNCTNGGARINFNVANANGYNLSYRVNAADPWSTSISISVPAAPGGTTYNGISVRYQQGGFECTMDLPDITLSSLGVITGSATRIANRTCDASGGTVGGQIDFTPASGGSGSGFVYSIDGLNYFATTSFANLAPGTYFPWVKDDGACLLELTSIIILDIDPPTDINFIATNSNCTNNTIDLQLVPTSNETISNYAIISPTTIDNVGSDTFMNLDASQSYIFQITDVNNCSYTEAYSPAIISTIRARVRAGADTQICTGAADGSGAFLIDGFANTYSYQINTDPIVLGQTASEVTLNGLGPATYTINIVDENTGCTSTANFTVQEPGTALSLLGTVTPMTCNNGNLGRVVANPTGGWGNNRYTLTYPNGTTTVGPKSGPNFGGLATPSTPGNPYTLSVEDAEGCTATYDFDLTFIDSPSISLDTVASDFCYDVTTATGATMVVTSTAGSAAIATHQYRLVGGPLQTSPIFPNLGPGNHTIEVVDGNVCSDAITITVNSQLRVSASIDSEIPCGGANGGIRIEVSGGYLANTTPKTIQISTDNGVTFTPQIPFSANDFVYDTNFPATYIFRVSDNEGCIADSTPITLNVPQTITPATANVTAASCGATDNGIVTIVPNPTTGIPPYLISFDGSPFDTQSTFSNLTAGATYSYSVRDARGCLTPAASVTIPTDTTAPPSTTLNEIQGTCSAGNIVAGGIQITNVVDGVEDFTFVVEDIFGNPITRVDNIARSALPITINDPSLVPGSDFVVFTIDANGCSSENIVSITTNEVVITPIPTTPPISCDNSTFTYTVQVTPTISPIVPTYQIRLAGQPAFYALDNSSGPDTHTFSNTADGIEYGVAYTVEVLHPNGCIYEQEIPPVDGFSDLEIAATSGGAFCDDNGNGQTDFTIVEFLGPNLTIELIELATDTVIDTDSPTGLSGGVGSSYSGIFNAPPGAYRILVTDSNGCTDATNIDVVLNAPRVDVLSNIPANCTALGQITFIGSGGTPFAGPSSPYLYAVVPQGNSVDEDGTATPSTADDFTDQTTRVLPGSLTGMLYDIWVLDSRGCTFNVTQEVIQLQPDLLNPTFIVDNQCAVASPSFDITVSVPASVNTPRFTLGGDSQFGVLNGTGTLWEWTYVVNNPGNYTVDVIDANGCTSQGIAEVFEFLSASGEFSTEPSCNNADGVITIYPNGGSNNFDYILTGTSHTLGAVTMNLNNITGNAVFTAISPGNYQVEVIDLNVADAFGNCRFTVNNINLEAVIEPSIDPVIPENITCFGTDDGAIEVTLAAGTDVDGPIDYRLLNYTTRALIVNNSSGSFTGLPIGNYEVEVVSASNCIDLSGEIVITAPPAFEISATATPFLCEPGANRFNTSTITVTVDPINFGTPTNYRYSITGFENYQTTNTFEIIDNGGPQDIIVYAIDDNGCRFQYALPTILPPSLVNPAIIENDLLDCAVPERVRISVPELTDFTVLTASAVAVAPVTNASGVTYVDVYLPAAGDYLFTVQDNASLGCSYPMPIHTVIAPIQPTVVIAETEPIGCFNASDGELSIAVTNYSGLYSYNVYRADDISKTSIASRTGLDTANNPETIPGLPGGNLIVEITSTATPFCSAESNVATIRTPNGPLTVTAVPVGNVSCNNNTGVIEATGVGGWDSAAYEYRLLYDDGSGYQEVVAFGSNHIFNVLDDGNGLSSGDYQVEIRDVEGCPDTFDVNLPIVPQIDAGIREPLALQCPNGNNAVLEAYDPTTGDAITATPGATGGFLNAGYTYRLLYLNGDDINVEPLNTDIATTSGLQNTPTFIGVSGGFISEGWYAIEVTSSFGCEFVTTPHYVNPPPPIDPRLVQTGTPGCGGNGQIRLFINNHDPVSNFEYEYRTIPTPDPINDPWVDFGVGVTERFFDVPGSLTGITYQFEVRKKNTVNTCDPVPTSGVTLIEADPIQIISGLITDPVSCNGAGDGRIEAFITGGVDDELFTLYIGEPISGRDIGAAQVFRVAQPIGTFEGIPPGVDYWIGVTSGVVCQDVQGPYAVVQPEPIDYVSSPVPTTCNGADDGQITIEVLSGGEGVLKFAIGPNFNEFFNDDTTPGIYTFEDLVAGSYEIIIQDESGCFERVTEEVTQPDVISTSMLNATPETCIGFADGTVQLNVFGGTPFVDSSTFETYYETRIVGPNSDGTELFVRNDDLFFDNLTGGESYTILIRDVNGCPGDIIVPIEIGVDLTASHEVLYGCDGIFPNSTASVFVADTSLASELLYALDPLDPTDAITANASDQTSWGNLAEGDHIVYIYHQNGCTNSEEFTVDAYEPLMLTAEKTGPNEVTALAEGGFGNYEYFFQGETTGSETVFTTNESTVVVIEVRDERGCSAVVTVPFEFTGMLEFPNFFTPDGDNNNDLWAPTNREFFPKIDVKIYDRYGRVVAVLDQVIGWNGKYEENDLPTGDYWYVVNANDKNNMRYVGHFTLYR